MGAVPLHRALQQIEYHTQHSSHYNHRVESNQSTLEEVAQTHAFAQAVVVSIADDETGQDEEEVYGQITVVDDGNEGTSGGKGQTFEDVVEHDQQGGYSSQPVE